MQHNNLYYYVECGWFKPFIFSKEYTYIYTERERERERERVRERKKILKENF